MEAYEELLEHGSNSQEAIHLRDILNWDEIQNYLDALYRVVHLAMGIIDMEGVILVSVGVQEICDKYHRTNPIACQNCCFSDVNLTKGVPAGGYRMYKCRNNLYDVATPLIIEGRHLGNFFVGQFFWNTIPSSWGYSASRHWPLDLTSLRI